MNAHSPLKTTLITKQGHEGGFEIDSFSGTVLNPSELPDWAEGLTNGLLAERHIFYTKRLGGLYTDDMKTPETLAFEDVTWLGVVELDEPTIDAETGKETFVELHTYDADHEFRMSIIAEVTGLSADLDLDEGTIANAITQAIHADNMRSPEELEALDKATNASWDEVSGSQKLRVAGSAS